jgi:hypothetical protein
LIDERFVRGQAVKARFGIAGLGQCRYGADLDETETKPGNRSYCDGILIEAARQSHRVGKDKGPDPDLQPVILHTKKPLQDSFEGFDPREQGQRLLMGFLRIAEKKQWANQILIEHGSLLRSSKRSRSSNRSKRWSAGMYEALEC